MAKFLDISGDPGFSDHSYCLTPAERLAISVASRRSNAEASGGTRVTVWAKPVHEVHDSADHMWVEFDDGHRQDVARGGPDAHRAGMFASAAFDDLGVMGQVDPARQSPDFGQGKRVIARANIPNLTAEEAIVGAQRHAAGVNRRSNRYGWEHNSNSYAADVFEDLTGRRVGDARTPGAQNRLKETGPRRPLKERARSLPYVIMPWAF